MKAAVVVSPGRIEVQELPVPELGATEILVRVVACGLCHSELGRFQGTGTMWLGEPLSYPLRLGHETVGIVEAVGRAVQDFRPGDRVTGIGFKRSFAEYVVIDLCSTALFTAVAKVPDAIPLELCISEPLKCCTGIVRHSQVKFGDYAFVAGCGFMGLCVIANLAWRGLSEIIACDLVDSRLELAKRMGATITLNARTADVAREVQRITGGRMCDVVFEGIGNPAGVALASQMIRSSPPPGHIILYGYHAQPAVYDLSLWGPRAPVVLSLHPEHSPDQRRDLEIAMQMIARGMYPLDTLITHRYSLEDIGKGFEALVHPPAGYLKGIVTF